jgi:cephalosporin hydroxylase
MSLVKKIKRHLRHSRRNIAALAVQRGGRSLFEIGLDCKTGKIMSNRYDLYYERHLGPIRFAPLVFLEIGIQRGKSLKMWEEYLPSARISAIDIDEKCMSYQSERSRVFIGSQTDKGFLLQVVKASGGHFDVIIDDGGHYVDQQLTSFQVLFPTLRSGGIYVIEDLETSYLEKFGGGPPGKTGTTVAFLKDFVDSLNLPSEKRGERLSSFPMSGLHLYPGIAFITKP